MASFCISINFKKKLLLKAMFVDGILEEYFQELNVMETSVRENTDFEVSSMLDVAYSVFFTNTIGKSMTPSFLVR